MFFCCWSFPISSYTVMQRTLNDTNSKTTDLIEQLEQSNGNKNEVLITSRKKAVYTITHELRTPLTAITGYTELLRKECNSGIMGNISKIYCNPPTVCGICSTLCLTSSVWTTARNSPVCHLCRISAITHTLETEAR